MTEGDVVWAKVTGHPWWPAVVTAVHPESLTVSFLGAQTQYKATSSQVPRDKVVDFRQNYERLRKQSKGSTRRKLLKSVSIALEMLDEPAPAPPVKRPISPIGDTEVGNITIPPSHKNALESASFSETMLPSVQTWLEQMHPGDMSPSTLRHLAVTLGPTRLGYIARRVYLDSQLVRVDRALLPVEQPELRRRVCRAIYRLMVESGVPAAQAKHKSLHAEFTLRQRDPEMTGEYRRGFQELSESLKSKVMNHIQRAGDNEAGAM